ncbi:MAG: peroxiredoxin [Nannocystaceae bacterium]|nr:redoxin domain-containing protein [bacterium]
MSNSSVLVTKPAPDFTCAAVGPEGEIIEDLSFSEFSKGTVTALVFYPLDFTFVCPSELIALDHRMETLRERDVKVLAVSIDSQFTHAAWRKTAIADGGIGPVRYTMAADVKHEICQAYGVEHGDGVALRATFLIDANGIVRAQLVNDLPLGRNMDELIRLVDALAFHEEHGEVCPAGWQRGQEGMDATTDGVAAYLSKHATGL